MMLECRWVFLVLMTVFCAVCWGEEVVGSVGDQDVQETVGRGLRQDFGGSNQWRAIEDHQVETSGWIPPSNPEGQPQKRRRLRKRKRRPQNIDEAEGDFVRPRRRRPIRLDEVRDSWREMEDEAPKRTYNRRRISPIYQQDEPATGMVSATIKFADTKGNDKTRDSYFAVEEAAEKKEVTTDATSTVQDIKALLKQSGGVSLSEILQQRNLTLSDLLKGKQQAISALTELPEVVTEQPTEQNIIVEKHPPIEAASRVYEVENSSEEIIKESLELQRNRLSMMYLGKENKIYSDVTKLDVITEATTEKRIFVPSHPKYYTSLDYRPELGISERIKEEKTTEAVTEMPITTTDKPTERKKGYGKGKLGKLPLTSAKMLQIRKDEQQETKLPPKAFEININDLFGFSDIVAKETSKGPLKMSFDIESLTKEIPVETTTIKVEKVTKKRIQSKLRPVTAKDEIMEFLSDEASKDNLEKILESRNMTVEELVEQRERGSSQRHLADIFHNKTKEPEPQKEHVVEIKVEMKPNVEIVETERKPKLKPLPDVSVSSEEIEVTDAVPGTSFPTYKIETNKRNQEIRPLPIWKTIFPPPKPQTFETENTLIEPFNDNLITNDYEDSYLQLPLAVKSAIFASLAIIAISIIVFLTILVIFRWTQRHKKRLCYSQSFMSCSKIKSPILEEDPKRTIRTFMSETLGKKKGIYTTHAQSMSDGWEKPYQ